MSIGNAGMTGLSRFGNKKIVAEEGNDGIKTKAAPKDGLVTLSTGGG